MPLVNKYIFPIELFNDFEFNGNSEVLSLKKDDVVDRNLLDPSNLVIIQKGIILLYWENIDNERTIIDFKSSGGWLYSSTYMKVEVGELNNVCLVDTELMVIGKKFMCDCAFHSREISELYGCLFSDDINATYNQLKLLKEVNLEKRYLAFMKDYKDIYNHISDKMISSFLGVHPTTLSRIKRKLLIKNENIEV